MTLFSVETSAPRGPDMPDRSGDEGGASSGGGEALTNATGIARFARRACAALAALALGGCAGFDWNGPMPIALAAQSALPERGQVSVYLEPDGVAVLRGWTESAIGEMAVVREIGARPEVTGVVNLLHRPYHLGFD